MKINQKVALFVLVLVILVLYILDFSIQQQKDAFHFSHASKTPTLLINDNLDKRQPSHYERFPAGFEFETYRRAHSQQVLVSEEERSLRNRRFAIAYYWCPERVGNSLHAFFNTVAWAIIHNRTVLVKYQSGDNVSTEAECQALLKRATWLPLYDDWKDSLEKHQKIIPVSLESFSKDDESSTVVLYPQIPDILSQDSNIARVDWIDDPSRPQYKHYLAMLPKEMQNSFKHLYSQGKEFLFGMFYQELFTLQIPAREAIFSNHDNNTTAGVSLALHSRHTVGADDGSNITHEIHCLEKLLHQQKDCHVYIMSDRPQTIDLLIDYLLQRNCSAVVANHTTDALVNDIAEHGPWSGAGFLLDLDIAGRAIHGVVGDRHRSSTALVVNAVEYHRQLSNVKMPFLACDLPKKSLSGYNYGPGTPTFRHHSYLDQLEPIQVVEAYQSQYQKFQPEQRYIVSYLNYEMATPNEVYQVLNSFLFAILSNRTFVLLENCAENVCDKDRTVLAPKTWLTQSAEVKQLIETSDTVNVHFENNPTALSENTSPVLRLNFDRHHYNLSHWMDATAPSSSAIGEKLYARGKEFLYGLLFHETLDIRDRIDPPFAPEDISIILDYSKVGNTTACLNTLLSSDEEQGSYHLNTRKRCHLLLLVNSEQHDDLVDFSSRECSFSFLNLSEDGWRSMDLAANARSGWIAAPDNATVLIETIIKERIQYYRHRETWKLGRDPFYISEFPECNSSKC